MSFPIEFVGWHCKIHRSCRERVMDRCWLVVLVVCRTLMHKIHVTFAWYTQAVEHYGKPTTAERLSTAAALQHMTDGIAETDRDIAEWRECIACTQ